MPKNPTLRLAPPAHAVPDSRLSVARALLDRWFPICQPVLDQAVIMLDPDGRGTENCTALENDPRYIIGRLHQALTALLAADVPPLDATEQLLGEAIRDAVNARRTTCPKCAGEMCADCLPNWQQASAYEALCSQLGIIDSIDAVDPVPQLKVAR